MKKNIFRSLLKFGALGTFFILAFVSGLFSKSSSGKTHHETGDNSLIGSLSPEHAYAEFGGENPCDSGDGDGDGGPGDC